MKRRKLIIPILLFSLLFPSYGQDKSKESGLKREVTLYNPYKPVLPEAIKRSFLPDITDTATVKPKFSYQINAEPFMPTYQVSPIKAASLLPDPISKLYKSYVNIGLGNYFTPMAEVSVTNDRSKKGTIGFYARHLSDNGKVELQNSDKVFAGFMDNEASLFGRKFLKKNLIEGSLDYNQKSRYAYGYDTSVVDFPLSKKDVRRKYDDVGAQVSFSSLTLDSADFSYDFDLSYDYFSTYKDSYQHNLSINGSVAKEYKGFYVGSGITFENFFLPVTLSDWNKYVFSVSPFIKKKSNQWEFNIGLQALFDRNITENAKFHIYPDVSFSFNIVPEYVKFFSELSGMFEKNDPEKIFNENPFLINDGSLYKLPSTSHDLIITAGVKGNSGMNGNYIVSGKYSMISDMIFYSNIFMPEFLVNPQYGNYFIASKDDVELLNLHGELNGEVNKKITYNGSFNIYHYSLAENEYAWGKPAWDTKISVKYNLREKILAGTELSLLGKRYLLSSGIVPTQYETNPYFNLNFSAEYRYTKILSFWAKLYNLSFSRYYEWANYRSQGMLFMLGFSYSL
jgi:hypothetical protein